MNVTRFLIRLPIVNIFMFSLFPCSSFKEYLLWVLEEKGLKLEDIWDKLSEKEQKILNEFDITPQGTSSPEPPPNTPNSLRGETGDFPREKISVDIKEDDPAGSSQQ